MNKKDYKAIAKIIKEHKFDLITQDYGYMDKAMIKDLADYFDKETECKRCNWTRKEHKKVGCEINGKKFLPIFNKKQFLKDCGVKE